MTSETSCLPSQLAIVALCMLGALVWARRRWLGTLAMDLLRATRDVMGS